MGWRRLPADLEHKLVFSNHSVLYWTALGPASQPDRGMKENIFHLFVKNKILEMMIVPHKAADFTFIRKLM